MLLRRVPAGAARTAQQGGTAQPAAAPQAAGNPVAQNPDGSAINPELMMQVMQGDVQRRSDEESGGRACV